MARPTDPSHDPLYDHLTADKQLSASEARQGYITEWNGLNKVKVAQTRRPTSEGEVRQALTDAKAVGVRVSTSGARHSSGGQSIAPGSMHIDMTAMRGLTYNSDAKTVTVK